MVELTNGSGIRLILSTQQWELMYTDVDARAPEEACGLLAGKGDQTLAVIPVTNELHSSFRFRMDPYEQLQAFQKMDDQGQELIGIYHSHPNGPDEPSPTDIAEAFYPEVIYIVWYKTMHEWHCKGFKIREGKVAEVELQLLDDW